MHRKTNGGKHRFTRRSKSLLFGTPVGLIGVVVGAMIVLTGSAQAATAFDNGSFEKANTGFTAPTGGFATLSAGTSSATAMANWTVTSGSVDWINSYWAAEDGTYSIDMNGTPTAAQTSTVGVISQTFTTVSGATYAVQFYLSANYHCGPATKSLSVLATGGTSTSFSADDASPMVWTAEQYNFTASSDTTTLTFSADSSNTSNCGAALDNVTVTQVLASGADCKDGGWATLALPDGTTFKNQGQCVSHFATSGDTPIGS